MVPAKGSSARAAWAASVISVIPSLFNVAAHVITTKKPIIPVSKDPVHTSMRRSFKSSRVKRLSTAYDWMKARPHGARVVPRVAVARKRASWVNGIDGTKTPRAA